MSVKRLLFAIALLAACDKPTKEDCRKALVNMQHLMGTESLTENESLDGEVRRCMGGSSTKSVSCAIKATTLDELKQCEFFNVPGKAAGNAGSAGSGSAGSGSAK
ncbi:MAG TPA: hypothetical protein VMJ10_07955 [Kofleriaceae bacterium]|nr:hypothetical protein [Kofleriaceae bacterium]